MRFLIDNNQSVHLVAALRALGHDAVHVRELGKGGASDQELVTLAQERHEIIISADRDFGGIVMELRTGQPSIVYLRGRVPRDPQRLARLLHDNLQPIRLLLEEGRIVVIEPGRLRLRQLPSDEA